MALARKFVLASNFVGKPKLSDFQLVEEELPNQLQDDEILVKAEWFSVDPYLRMGNSFMQIGTEFTGQQVGRVVKSKNREYPEGCQVFASFGWRDLTIHKPRVDEYKIGIDLVTKFCYRLPDLKGLQASYALGATGMPGNTAYFAVRLAGLKEGETVVVSTAAGAVGSLVGQIAKIKGCTVIGFTGDDSKVEWLKKDLRFDNVFNYKKVGVFDALQKYAPQGIDVFFDYVGGEFSYNVMRNMNNFGRIVVSGAASTYNEDFTKPAFIPFDYFTLIYKQIKIEGFQADRWKDDWFDGISQMRDWILEGKIKPKETIREGFEHMPQAFIELLEGKNVGKMLVKV